MSVQITHVLGSTLRTVSLPASGLALIAQAVDASKAERTARGAQAYIYADDAGHKFTLFTREREIRTVGQAKRYLATGKSGWFWYAHTGPKAVRPQVVTDYLRILRAFYPVKVNQDGWA